MIDEEGIVLINIKRKGKSNVSDLIRYIYKSTGENISYMTIMPILKKLKTKGLISVRKITKFQFVEITEKGNRISETLEKVLVEDI